MENSTQTCHLISYLPEVCNCSLDFKTFINNYKTAYSSQPLNISQIKGSNIASKVLRNLRDLSKFFLGNGVILFENLPSKLAHFYFSNSTSPSRPREIIKCVIFCEFNHNINFLSFANLLNELQWEIIRCRREYIYVRSQ